MNVFVVVVVGWSVVYIGSVALQVYSFKAYEFESFGIRWPPVQPVPAMYLYEDSLYVQAILIRNLRTSHSIEIACNCRPFAVILEAEISGDNMPLANEPLNQSYYWNYLHLFVVIFEAQISSDNRPLYDELFNQSYYWNYLGLLR